MTRREPGIVVLPGVSAGAGTADPRRDDGKQ